MQVGELLNLLLHLKLNVLLHLLIARSLRGVLLLLLMHLKCGQLLHLQLLVQQGGVLLLLVEQDFRRHFGGALATSHARGCGCGNRLELLTHHELVPAVRGESEQTKKYHSECVLQRAYGARDRENKHKQLRKHASVLEQGRVGRVRGLHWAK